MKKVMHFLKSSYLIVIGIAIGATILTVGALSIPTDIDNSVQTIKTIYLSTDGVSTGNATGVVVTLSSDPASDTKIKVVGNMEVGQTGNKVQGGFSSVMGGKVNSVSGSFSTVGGGGFNNLTGDGSVIPGGWFNKVNANYSFAFGYNAQAVHNNTFVRSDGAIFASTQANTFLIRARNGVAIGTGVTLGMNSLRVWDGTTGRIAAEEYCDQNGTGCQTIAQLTAGGGTAAGPVNAVQFNNPAGTFSGTSNLVWNGGKLGIGINTPQAALHIMGTVPVSMIVGGITGFVQFTNDTTGFTYIDSKKGISTNTNLILNNAAGSTAGFVGIGTNAPTTKLEVNGGLTVGDLDYPSFFVIDGGKMAVGLYGDLPTEDLDVGGNIRVRNIPATTSSTNVLAKDVDGTFRYITVTNLLSGNGYRGKTGTYIYNTNTSNVGIGTATPLEKLHVHGKAQIGNTLRLYSNDVSQGTPTIEALTPTKSLLFVTSGSEAMRITPDGNVGIRTISPSEALEVNGNISLSPGADRIISVDQNLAGWGNNLVIHGGLSDDGLGGGEVRIYGGGSAGEYSNVILAQPGVDGGNVGIGTALPGEKLETIGNSLFRGNVYVLGLEEYLDEYNTTAGSVYDGAFPQWQSFTATNDGYLTKVQVLMALLSASSAADVYIYAGEGVSGSPIAHGTRPAYSSTAGVWLTINLDAPVHLNGGGIYTIQLHGVTGVDRWKFGSGSPYLNGRSSLNATYDFGFKTYMSDNIGSGNVGVGMMTPTEKLDVNGNVRIRSVAYSATPNNFLAVDSSGVVRYGLVSELNISSYWSGNGTNIYNTNAGNIGINTSSPDANSKLDINGSMNIRGDFKVGVGDGRIQKTLLLNRALVHDDRRTQFGGTIGDTLTMNFGGDFEGGVAIAGPGLIVDNVVGIGVAAPHAALQFANSAANRKIVLWENANNDHQYYGFGINSSALRYQTDSLSSDHIFYAASSSTTSNELMRIRGNGNVGIGVAAPSAKLEVNGAIYAVGGNYESHFAYGTYADPDSGVGRAIKVGAGGLAVNGDAKFNNNVYASAYYYSSDKKLKDNLELIQNPLEKILSLNGYYFTWKSNGQKSVGVIAQEVEKVFPELVNTDDKGVKSVQYGNLVAPIIESIKSLYAKYVDQQETIESLEARVAKLEQLVNAK